MLTKYCPRDLISPTTSESRKLPLSSLKFLQSNKKFDNEIYGSARRGLTSHLQRVRRSLGGTKLSKPKRTIDKLSTAATATLTVLR